MGRTNPTQRDRLDRLERDWGPFRRALRYRHQDDLDRLFEHARGHVDAAGQQNPADVWRAFAMGVLLAQERERRALAERVATLEAVVGEGDDAGSDTADSAGGSDRQSEHGGSDRQSEHGGSDRQSEHGGGADAPDGSER